MADIAAVKYRAFLSYSHCDRAWAKWLHSALEGYRIDKGLVGRDTAVGPVPKTLHANRGLSYAGKGERDQALVEFEKALAIDPKLERAIEGLNRLRRAKLVGAMRRARWSLVDWVKSNTRPELAP